MTSSRQRARARRTDRFWRDKADRATTPFDRASIAYDRARAEVGDLPPDRRPAGWQLVERALAELHDRWADERGRDLWDRHVVGEPQRRVWAGWRRLWAVARRQPDEDGVWEAVEYRLSRLVATVRDVRSAPNSAEPAGVSARRRRGPAGVPRATRGNGTAEFGAENTHSDGIHGGPIR